MSTPTIDTRRFKDQRWLTAHNAWNTHSRRLTTNALPLLSV